MYGITGFQTGSGQTGPRAYHPSSSMSVWDLTDFLVYVIVDSVLLFVLLVFLYLLFVVIFPCVWVFVVFYLMLFYYVICIICIICCYLFVACLFGLWDLTEFFLFHIV